MLLKVVFAGSAYPPTHCSFLQVPSDANFCDTKISRQHIFRGGQDDHFATFKTKIGPLQPSDSRKRIRRCAHSSYTGHPNNK